MNELRNTIINAVANGYELRFYYDADNVCVDITHRDRGVSAHVVVHVDAEGRDNVCFLTTDIKNSITWLSTRKDWK